MRDHPDKDVAAAIRRLCDALCSWERATGRQSVFVVRENNGEMPGERMTAPGFVFRADCGKPLDPGLDDITDSTFLAPFTFSHTPAASEEE